MDTSILNTVVNEKDKPLVSRENPSPIEGVLLKGQEKSETLNSNAEATDQSTVQRNIQSNDANDSNNVQVSGIQFDESQYSNRTRKEIRKTYLKNVTVRGQSGLTNLGNTCYLNSAMQALSATDTFMVYMLHPESPVFDHIKGSFLDEMFQEHEKKNAKLQEEGKEIEDLEVNIENLKKKAKKSLTYRIRILFKYMWHENCEVSPRQFKRGVDMYLNLDGIYSQQDSQEFLTLLLHKIHEETKALPVFNYEFPKDIQEYVDELKAHEENLSKLTAENNDGSNQQLIRECTNALTELQKRNMKWYMNVKSILRWEVILNRDKYSVINDIFSGMYLTTITCNECKNTKYTFERFDILTLHFPEDIDIEKQEYTLEELLQMYVKEELMDDKNKYLCGYCAAKQPATQKHVLYQLPEKLVIMIKKYQVYKSEKIKAKTIKTNTRVNYQHDLDLNPYMSEFCKGQDSYELYATIRHSGGMGGGHYYAYCKNPMNKLWFLHDNGDVYHADDKDPLSSNSYILFYQRKQS